MGGFKAKSVQVTPTPAPAPVAPAPEKATKAKTRSKYAGAIKEKRAAEEAKVAKKKLLGD